MDAIHDELSRLYKSGASIRPALVRDIPELLEIEKVFPSDRLSGPQFLEWLIRPTATILVAHNRNDILGYALGHANAKISSIRLFSLAIASKSQREGLGSALLGALEEHGLKSGLRQMHLEVHCDNIAAQRFYFNQGFKKFGAYSKYYSDGARALRLRKELSARIYQVPVNSARFASNLFV